jgi:GntR family transcriptional regulator
LGSFAQAVREHHAEVSTEVLEWSDRSIPPERVRQFLGDGERVLVRRLRLGDGVPLALESAWLLRGLIPEPTAELLSGSLYDLLDTEGSLPDAGEEAVRADLPTADEARALKVSRSRPVFRLSRRAFRGGRPVEYAEAVLPADRYELWFPLDV